MATDNFDEELEKAREFVETKLRKEFTTALADLEKRMLLRFRGNPAFCRICASGSGEHAPYRPALTDLERLYHEGNHGEYSPPNPSSGLPVLGRAIDWDEFEKQVKARRRP